MHRKPFTVIAGFLGAGKTTLVNNILGQATGTRFAVLVNDFGAINVDARLIAAHDGQTMALTNGCICCSLSDGFVQAMLGLMSAPERFDHVIVEASGVSLPDRIMDFARIDPLLQPDAIVTLVDADSVAERLADPLISDMVTDQIVHADMLILNKCDLVVDPSLPRRLLSRLASDTPVLECRHAEVPFKALLGTGLRAGDHPGDDAHGTSLRTWHVASQTAIDLAEFERWADSLPPTVLRGKGTISLPGERQARIWQRVGQRNSLSAASVPAGGAEIVLIGTDTPLEAPGWASVFRTRKDA